MNHSKPDWYEQAKGGPFDQPLFTPEMKQEVSRRLNEKPSYKKKYALGTVMAIVVCLTVLLIFIRPNDYNPAPALPDPPQQVERPIPTLPENEQPPEPSIPALEQRIPLFYEDPLDYPEDYPVDVNTVTANRISVSSIIVQRIIEVSELGNYVIYLKQEGDFQLYSGMEILTDGPGSVPTGDLYEIGPVGELPYLNDIEITKSNLFGQFHIRIYGVCGANCVTNDWITFEDGAPTRDFRLYTHAQEVDIDEDGTPEIIATVASTIGKVLIYKKINDQIQFVDLNKELQAEHPYSVIYEHNYKIFSAIFPNLKRMYQYKAGEDVMELIQNAEGGTDPLLIGGVYDGTEAILLQVGETAVQANWFKDPYRDFGLYLPSSVKKIKFEDGYEYETTNGMGIIQLREADASSLPYLRKENDLIAYSEYLGSEFWGDDMAIRYDYFLYEHDEEHRTYIAIRYQTKDTEQIRPLLLSIIANAHYSPDH